MDVRVIEASYPVSFRQENWTRLAGYLKQRQCVNLIGMKRVGISNFLRFFLSHKADFARALGPDKHLFIPVDLDDLVEREVYPFWTLTLKRIVDASEKSTLPAETKERINALFLQAIQSQDLFLVIDSIRSALTLIVEQDRFPTFFFVRFDRLHNVLNPSFFNNLEGILTATNYHTAYVFTSYRNLEHFFPSVRTSIGQYTRQLYIPPVQEEDAQIIYKAHTRRLGVQIPKALEPMLFSLVNGNVQYLQLALILLSEQQKKPIQTPEELKRLMLKDERVTLESEELWESLFAEEKKVLVAIAKHQEVEMSEQKKAQYLWDTGMVTSETSMRVFSPLLEHYVLQRDISDQANNKNHFTKKEHVLYKFLEKHMGEICEREQIIEAVWPEYSAFGVSDWAIDRLVARVRAKLREQRSAYKIVTVRTRGYKLASDRT